MFTSLIQSPSAARRLERAASWLAEQPAMAPVLIVADNLHAADAIVREVVTNRAGAAFGWHRITLRRLALTLAEPSLAKEGLAPATALSREAVIARVVHELAQSQQLGRYEEVRERPGLPRALAETIDELRLGGVDLSAVLFSADLWRMYQRYLGALEEYGLADSARVFELATAAVHTSEPAGSDELGHAGALLGLPTLLLDVEVPTDAGSAFVRALAERVAAAAIPHLGIMATVAAGDERSRTRLESALGVRARSLQPRGSGPLARIQGRLFGERGYDDADRSEADHRPERDDLAPEVRFLSAPGESRECVEIAREVLREAESGVPFDRMAVVLRSPSTYAGPLVEAFRRAGVPLHLARGARLPNPAGRALLALLGCAAEGLSASRFAEYVSLGQVPPRDADGAPLPAEEAWVPPEALDLPGGAATAADAAAIADAHGEDGYVATPRRWERLLVDAAVIGGLDRWRRRLAGLSEQLERRQAAIEDPEAPRALGFRRTLRDLSQLRRFAMPILDELALLPTEATWGVWLKALSKLATRALRYPAPVQTVLAELQPMADVGPVGLDEVRVVLARRLTEAPLESKVPVHGAVYAGPTDGIRGRAFDVVFVPGLAERVFPQKIREDPILLDRARLDIGAGLDTFEQRVADERLYLRLAVGAARQRLVLSWPRVEVEKGRPRVPSFYCLELLRAARGRLPGFQDLQRLAERGGAPRVGWPAPEDPIQAIDEAEHDLAWLRTLFGRPVDDVKGAARYLVDADASGHNPHLARALRARWCRHYSRQWTPSDGLLQPSDEARAALDEHLLTARSFSATALQNFAKCPYRFLLYAVHRLGPREEPAAIEQLDALSRGSLIHEVQFELLCRLRDTGLLPVTTARLDEAHRHMEAVVSMVEAKYRDLLAPAIERVWRDEIALIRSDIGEWLFRQTEDTTWEPWRFELSFGLPPDRDQADVHSRPEPAQLPGGLQLRGSIDLVERGPGGRLRATDYKTGRASMKRGAVIEGGKTLQPVLYALALEAISAAETPDAEVSDDAEAAVGPEVESGRLYYCTARGAFDDREVALDQDARAAADQVTKAVGWALREGMFPAAPDKDACRWCDYGDVCGAEEERRTADKPHMAILPLINLRRVE